MTQRDEMLAFIRTHPGARRSDMREQMPTITHEYEILSELLADGLITRRHVDGKTKEGAWGHWVVSE